MVRWWHLAGLALLCCADPAHSKCTDATEDAPSLCPIKLPRIVTVQIEENGARMTDADPNLDCAKFKLDAASVRRYFSKAKQADEADAHHTLDWLPCYANGTLRFSDGKTARWHISISRTGALVAEGNERVFLYCPDCKFKPFLP